MSSLSKYLSINTQDKGFDDIGMAEPSGTISAIADAKTATGRWAGKLMLTVNDNTKLRVGQAINITALDTDHNGLTRILAIPKSASDGTGTIVVDITFDSGDSDATGVWDTKGGAGAWDAFQVLGADLTGTNIALTFWKPANEASNESAVTYTKDQVYKFPAIIKTALISTAGNIRLIRYATNRPWGLNAQ